jgi:hypothetical protein
MRYTKAALLAFGGGLLLGLAVIAGELKSLQRVASGLMALGIAAIPVGMIVDWRRAVRAATGAPRQAKIPARRNAHTSRRPRRSPSAKR